MQRVLIIDDEPAIRDVLERFLRSRNYEIRTADSGASAIEAASQESFVLALCDVAMPGLSGIDTVKQLMTIDPDLAVIMITGANDARTAMNAVELGAKDYLLKPISLKGLEHAVERALHKRGLLIEQRRVERIIREEVAERTAELEQEQVALRALTENLRAITINIAEALINAMEAKDPHLRGHSQRVAATAAAVAEQLGLDSETVEEVRLAARLHDVGTIGVRETVLNKPGKLTADEIDHVRQHVRIGLEILSPLEHLGPALDFVRDHHEHWDGGGYPAGVSGDDISIGGRILAACDTFDALTSTRAYHDKRTPAQALEYMQRLLGTVLDANVYTSLEKVVLENRALIFMDDEHAPSMTTASGSVRTA